MWEEAEFKKTSVSFLEKVLFGMVMKVKKIDNWNIDLRWVFNKCNLNQNINSSTEGKCINPNKNLGSSVYSR